MYYLNKETVTNIKNKALTLTQTKLNYDMDTIVGRAIATAECLKCLKTIPSFRKLHYITEEMDNLVANWNDETSPTRYSELLHSAISEYPVFAILKHYEMTEQINILVNYVKEDGDVDITSLQAEFSPDNIHTTVTNLLTDFHNKNNLNFEFEYSLDKLSNENIDIYLKYVAETLVDQEDSTQHRLLVERIVELLDENRKLAINNPTGIPETMLDDCYFISEEIFTALEQDKTPDKRKEINRMKNAMNTLVSYLKKNINIIHSNQQVEFEKAAKEHKREANEYMAQVQSLKKLQRQASNLAVFISTLANLYAINEAMLMNQTKITEEEKSKLIAQKRSISTILLPLTQKYEKINDYVYSKSTREQVFSINKQLWQGNEWCSVPTPCGAYDFTCDQDHKHGLHTCANTLATKWYDHVEDCKFVLTYSDQTLQKLNTHIVPVFIPTTTHHVLFAHIKIL